MPILKKNDKYYARVNYTNFDGKYKSIQSKYVDTKREAVELENEIRNKLGITSNRVMTFSDAYKDYIGDKKAKNVSLNTLQIYGYYFNALGSFSKLKLDKITQQHINTLSSDLAKRYKNVSPVLSFVKSIIDKTSKKYKIVTNHIDISNLTKAPTKKLNFYTKDDFELLVANTDNIIYKTLFTLMFYNGLRISEARALQFKDIVDGHIEINKQCYKDVGITDRLKTQHSYRTIPLNQRTLSLINDLECDYKQYYGYSDDFYIFGGIKPSTEKQIRFALNKAITKANLKRITIHDLRHSCASYYIHLDYPINLIAELLGDNINTIYNTYYHLYKKDLNDMIAKSE